MTPATRPAPTMVADLCSITRYIMISLALQSTLLRHQHAIDTALRETVNRISVEAGVPALNAYYGQMQYHLGWVDAALVPTQSNPGKLLRPTLLLLAYEAAGAWGLAETATTGNGYIERALPAAVAIELTHNFTLIHDDIEDGDTERRHRPTLWKLWDVPQAINTGDGIFSLARLALWGILQQGVSGEIAARLGAALDRACLVLSEGQYLDINFETRQDISVAAYLDMISRKTAALMACAAEMGARLGTSNQETIDRLRGFGHAMGVAFQVRDDMLGVWASSAELGKTPAGDIYRRKKSLPVLHALEHASSHERLALHDIYSYEGALTTERVEEVLAIFQRTETREYCREFLRQQCRLAYEALASVPHHASPVSTRAIEDMETMVRFVEEAIS